MKKFFNFIFSDRFFPILMFLLTVLCYGLFIPFMGYFMDDWYLIWFKHTFGAAQFPLYFSLDRPFMGYFYTFASFLLGNAEQPIVWHIFGLVTRWLVAYSLWGMLNTLWPENRRQNIWVCLLAIVFPGFSQHSEAVVYCFFYACLAGFFFSITLMLKALQDRKHFWLLYLASLIIGTYCLIAPEFFTGLELIRGVILWIYFSRKEPNFWGKVKKTMQYWGAYLVIFIVFMIWRGFLFNSVNHPVVVASQIKLSPLSSVIKLTEFIINAVRNALIEVWHALFVPSSYPGKGVFLIAILVLDIALFVAVFLWQRISFKIKPELSQSRKPNWLTEAFWLGSISLVVSIIPFWAADLEVTNTFPNDRFLLAFLFGSCLMIIVFLEFIGGKVMPVVLVVSFLTAASSGIQLTNSYRYKNTWNAQTDFYWQLVWRMPGIEPGTAIMTYQLPNEEYYSGNALTAQLNWTYNDGALNRKIPYQFIILNTPQKEYISSFEKNQNYIVDFRTYQFEGNTDKTIFISYELPGCLRVVDVKTTPLYTISYTKNSVTDDAERLSNPSLISYSTQKIFHPPMQVLGKEAAHTWCYYFEKAELNFQYGNYQEVIDLLNAANQKGFYPQDPTEWYPFIKSYALSGDWQSASELTIDLSTISNGLLRAGLCRIWHDLAQTAKTNPAAAIITENVIGSMDCSH